MRKAHYIVETLDCSDHPVKGFPGYIVQVKSGFMLFKMRYVETLEELCEYIERCHKENLFERKSLRVVCEGKEGLNVNHGEWWLPTVLEVGEAGTGSIEEPGLRVSWEGADPIKGRGLVRHPRLPESVDLFLYSQQSHVFVHIGRDFIYRSKAIPEPLAGYISNEATEQVIREAVRIWKGGTAKQWVIELAAGQTITYLAKDGMQTIDPREAMLLPTASEALDMAIGVWREALFRQGQRNTDPTAQSPTDRPYVREVDPLQFLNEDKTW